MIYTWLSHNFYLVSFTSSQQYNFQGVFFLYLLPNLMTLLDLPCEILLSIAENCDEPRDILSFACTTHCTYNILRGALYRSCAQQLNCSALHYAAKQNRRDIAEELLRHGADPNCILKTSTALIVAAAFGSESVIDLLLTREGIDVNARNMNGETAIWRAAYAGKKSAVLRLLQHKDLQIDVPDTFHEMTPFALAVANKHVGVAKVLLDTNRVDLNARDKCGRPPLYHAVVSKHMAPVLLLLSRREVNLHAQDRSQCTPLWYAAECGNLDAAQLLIMNGANPNIPDFHHITPLNNAILQRDAAMVRLLLEQHGLEISPPIGRLERAQPPLCAAVCTGDGRILSMLLRRGADVNVYNDLGYQPLHLAVQKGDTTTTKMLLNHKNTSVNERTMDGSGFTALHQAAYDGRLPIVNLLLTQADIEFNAKDAERRTPIWWATVENHSLVTKRLLAESNLELTAAGAGLSTPLHHAVNRGNKLIVHLLLAEKALDPNVADKDGLTPLEWAARVGDSEMVDLLLTREDIRVNAGSHRSSLSLAAERGHFSIVLRLLRYTHVARLTIA